jgi:SAM-dependent methyltransferase
MEESKLREQLEQFNWYHTFQLTPNVATPGWPVVVPIVEMTMRTLRFLDLRGKRVLDIGCRDGLFSFEAERLGAREVIGFDNKLTPGIPDFLIQYFRSNVRIETFDLYDLAPAKFGLFEVVIFPGTLYHLRYPFWALKLVRDVMPEGGKLVLETAFLVDDNRHALLFCPIGDESPYEPTSCTFFNFKGLTDTLGSFGFVVETADRLLKLEHPPGRPLHTRPEIDRCTLVCRKVLASNDSQTAAYWDGAPGGHNIPPTWDSRTRSQPTKK